MARMKGADVARMYGAGTPTKNFAASRPDESGGWTHLITYRNASQTSAALAADEYEYLLVHASDADASRLVSALKTAGIPSKVEGSMAPVGTVREKRTKDVLVPKSMMKKAVQIREALFR